MIEDEEQGLLTVDALPIGRKDYRKASEVKKTPVTDYI